MNKDFSFCPDLERDPDGSRLYRVLEATVTCGRIQTLREWLSRLVVTASIPVGVATLRPVLLPQVVRGLGLAVWAAGCVALSIAGIVEWRCRKLLARNMADMTLDQRRS